MTIDIDHISPRSMHLDDVHNARVSELIANANRLEQQARDARAELNQYRRRITALISEPTAGMALLLQDVRTFHQACVDAVTGKVAKRADGKVLKPPGWVGPDIAGILGIGA